MEITYIGANVRSGISEKNGRPYSIAEVLYMIPDSSSEKRSPEGVTIWTYIAHGYRVRTLPLMPSKISEFADVKVGSRIKVLLEPLPENPTKNVVSGIVN